MVGRKKAAASTAKSTGRQQTLLDLFPKKTQLAVPPSPPTVAAEAPKKTHDQISSSSPTDRIASTSKAVEIIDITGPEPASKPPSKRKEPSKPSSSRSSKPVSKADSRFPEPTVIDLTSHESSPPNTAQSTVPTPTPKPIYQIFASRTIDAPSNTLPSTTDLPPSKPTYSIFNVRPKKPSEPVFPTKPPIALTESYTPFPTKEDQHVRGPQSTFSAPKHRKRSFEKGTATLPDNFRFRMDVSEPPRPRTLTRTPAASFWDKEQCIEKIPSNHKLDHPAIARLSASISSPLEASSSSEKLWSERWRPQRADGVLGNEQRAVYLRDWLRALEIRFENASSANSGTTKGPEVLRGAKRPQVMRSVTRARKRRRQSSDGFVVSDASDYSSETEEPVGIDGDDDDDFHPPAETEDPSPSETIPNAFKDHLANTIILSGPSGVGKTTAVYSCAEELGWEVFEVYPGIGKRNGASLETLVGDVGKNHLVRRTQAKGIFNRGNEEADPDISDDFGFVTQKRKASEDANFWPAVIRLIKDCKRPIICTCNDISLVPTSDLPLQTILEFDPCPPDVAGSYLQGLCCVEGHIVDRDVLVKIVPTGLPP
ncbi:hypothetical protein B0H11DRAFT_749926 [Mycena galericulata]|nr:hypothetical protein B0H11DRAFT_749926 [Mycena galericulata]